jgi:calcineurin-like phosphoesterase family protein
MRRYISDLHFFHDSLNRMMDGRGFADAAEMNAHMISQWNKKVRRSDEVVILGDLSVGNGGETSEILKQLKGRLCLITGNHDRYLKDKEFDPARFEWIKPYAELRDNRRKVVLSHYPVFCYNGQNRRNDAGEPKTYMLYGHVHNTLDEVLVNRFIRQTRETVRPGKGEAESLPIPCQMINCFCMFSDYMPLTLDEWIAVDEARRRRL